jgi:O-antigen/teichoic acid export membrane protein
MNKKISRTASHTLDGTIWNFLGDSLALPLGFLVVIFLTRRLGPEGYGLYALVCGLILWVEWSIVGLFSKATIKLVGETDDWQPLGAALIRTYLYAGLAAGGSLWLLATPVSLLMKEPQMAGYLRLFAVDIPLFTLAQSHKNLLVGIGAFRPRAFASAARWTSRLLLIVALVEVGFSVHGAILGNIAASVVELAICRRYIRLPFFTKSAFPVRVFWSYALPLFLSSMSLSLFTKVDLFALKALGGSAAEAGVYGAAQNLSLIPGVFAFSFSSLILSNLSRLLRDGEEDRAKSMASNSMRVIILLLPFAGITFGSAGEIIDLLFGTGYSAASLPLSLLFFGAIAQSLISVVLVILAARGNLGWTFALTGPLVPLAVVAHLIVIPRMGAVGAAMVTTVFSVLGAMAVSLAIFHLWRVLLPLKTLVRSSLLSILAFAVTAFLPATGILLPIKLLVTGLAVFPAFWILGEFDNRDLAFVGDYLSRRSSTATNLREK